MLSATRCFGSKSTALVSVCLLRRFGWSGARLAPPRNVPATKPVVVEQAPAQLKLAAALGAAGQTGTVQAEYEVDGLMWWTLTLLPDDQPIDSLRLVIPLRNELMPLMHTCTDGIRINTGRRHADRRRRDLGRAQGGPQLVAG